MARNDIKLTTEIPGVSLSVLRGHRSYGGDYYVVSVAGTQVGLVTRDGNRPTRWVACSNDRTALSRGFSTRDEAIASLVSRV
jgi:hypothetical protein